MRERVGDDFFLAYDCWMSLDLDYALRLAEGLRPYGFRWIEECLPPDDYWGYAELRRRAPPGLLVTTGEHEAGLHGFRLLVDMGCCDFVQPDVGWCGGLTELLRIAAYAEAHGVRVVPHGSSVYSYHFAVTRPATRVRRVPDDVAGGRRGGADVQAAPPRRAACPGDGRLQRPRAARVRGRAEPRSSSSSGPFAR